jgi:hypothetical protein
MGGRRKTIGESVNNIHILYEKQSIVAIGFAQ